jgi:hypothetical protein
MIPTELELLAIQANASLDRPERVPGLDGFTILGFRDRNALLIGAEVRNDVAAELVAAFHSAPTAGDPSVPPPALDRCRRIVERHDRVVRCSSGPSFVIPPDTRFDISAPIVRSDRSKGESLRGAGPGNWEPVEWEELLDGRLGPSTISTEGGRIASICHTPHPPSARGAECGVWTHPDFRGRGHAAATTAAWAAIMQPRGQHLFYRTDAKNLSSQAVARRLNLRSIGWTWRVACPPERVDTPVVHPLSSLRARRLT